VAARQRAGNPRSSYEQPAPPKGWPRPILDSGAPTTNHGLAVPTRGYQSDRASRTACRTATHPADHITPPHQPTLMRKINDPHLTTRSPYQEQCTRPARSASYSAPTPRFTFCGRGLHAYSGRRGTAPDELFRSSRTYRRPAPWLRNRPGARVSCQIGGCGFRPGRSMRHLSARSRSRGS
jgi:hypothetical protein